MNHPGPTSQVTPQPSVTPATALAGFVRALSPPGFAPREDASTPLPVPAPLPLHLAPE